MPKPLPLKYLHSEDLLLRSKLDGMGRLSTDALLKSLEPGQRDSLKVRPDGTILDGHHRRKVLESRGVDVHALPREIIHKIDA